MAGSRITNRRGG
jgi:hypothetical protein